MRKYLATLHKRSDRHKQNFALLVSGGMTLSIFAVWLFVNYGSTGSSQAVAQSGTTNLAAAHEIGPLESLGDSLASSWEAIESSIRRLAGDGFTTHGR